MSELAHLRSLSPSKFEHLCFRVLNAKYPYAGLKMVEGSGGDKGLDIFSGLLGGRPVIWQCKRFDYVRQAQKKQIRKSLETALRHYQPLRWVLCTTVNLTAKNHEWFQSFQQEYSERTVVELMQGSDIWIEVLRRPDILDDFFPNLQIDPGRIKALLSKTADLSTPKLGQVAQEHVEQLKRRLENKDARFTFGVTFPPDGIGSAEEMVQQLMRRVPPPGIVMSASDGSKIIDFYARDLAGLSDDPPTVTIRMSGEVAGKLQQAIKLGARHELEPVDILQMPSVMAELFPSGLVEGCKVIVGPSRPTRRAALRVEFASSQTTIVYERIEFAVLRQGTEEIEIRSVQEDLPFELSAIENISGVGRLALKQRLKGREIHAVRKWIEVLTMLLGGAELKVFGPARNAPLIRAVLTAKGLPIPAGGLETLDNLQEVSDRSGQPVHVSDKWSPTDYRTLRFLLDAVRTGRARRDDVDSVTILLTRNPQLTPEGFPADCECPFSGQQPESATYQIGDDHISLGRHIIGCQRATLQDYSQTKEAFFAAKEGQPVSFSFKLHSCLECIFPRFLPAQQAPPGQPAS
jgi:hypothetical protein